MIYVYPKLQKEYKDYVTTCERNVVIRFGNYGITSIDDLRKFRTKTQEMMDFIYWFDKKMPVGIAPCTINKICWRIEEAFADTAKKIAAVPFDASILKSGVKYSKMTYNQIAAIYKDYQKRVKLFMEKARTEKLEKDGDDMDKETLLDEFRRRCSEICPNEKELADIIIDLCYNSDNAKSFAWDICGETIIDNLLEKHNGEMTFPQKVDFNGDFEYSGELFRMVTITKKRV